jgi:hypothetical protein
MTFPAIFQLSSLNGTNGFAINGINAFDSSGWSVSSAGDVNGDGFADLIIGARGADPNGKSGSGQSYVVFGRRDGFSEELNLSTLNGTNGFAINGINVGDSSGLSVSSAGDVNSDGFADLIIGAIGADRKGNDSGQSYVVFGRRDGFSEELNLSTLNETNGFTINGINAYDFSGVSVSSAGDVNGDGFADLIIGANNADPKGPLSGQSYVVFGRRDGFSAELNLSELDGTNGFILNGVNSYDFSGYSVSSAGDVNGDGLDDLIIGTRGADPNGNLSSGQSYVVFGRRHGFGAELNLSDLNGSNGFAINGINAYDYSGRSVSSAGDVNGDGFADLIIGARGADPNNKSGSGQSYVVFGRRDGFSAALNLSTLNGSNGFAINGINAFNESGWSVSSAGDVNGDGFDDLIIGAPSAAPNGNYSGQSYVVFGRRDGFSEELNLSPLNGSNGFAISGIKAGDFSGASVSGAGDVNGDGFADLIIGAIDANPNGGGSGQSYVVFGTGLPTVSLTVSSGSVAEDGTKNLIYTFTRRNGSFANPLTVNYTIAGTASNGTDYGLIGTSVTFAANATTATVIVNPKADAIVESGETISLTLANDANYYIGTTAAVTAVISNDDGNEVIPFAATLQLSSLNGTNGFAINGISAGDLSGYSVSSAGDVNGDGFDDLIIGALRADPNVKDSGQSYVVFGRRDGFSAELNLSDLNGSNGFAINGINAYDFSGVSVSSAGDVNGDGFADLIIGATGADSNGDASGQSYVVFGRHDGFAAALNLSTLNGSNGFAINGINAYDRSGRSVSSARDVNGDGFDDLIIGTRGADPNGNYSGQSYVVFGRRDGFAAALNLSTLNGTNGFAINGINSSDGSGDSVSSAGDVNGDGFADLIIGASGADPNGNLSSGQSYVVFGRRDSFDAALNLSTLNGSNGFILNGINANDLSSRSVSSAGDVNGDGFDDLIIGADRADSNGKSNSGQSYVFFGKSGGFSAIFDFSSLNGTNGFAINGINIIDNSGWSVNSAGDVNGDGFADLIIGAPSADPNGDYSGQSYVVFGRRDGFGASLNLDSLNGSNGFTINGISVSDYSGWSVSSAGDVNGDGFADLIIGARGADSNGNLSSGQSYVVFGRATLPVISLSVSPDRVAEDGTRNLVYTFTRNGSLTNPLTVNYTIGGTASNGTDYVLIGTSVTFAANATTAKVIVNPLPDTTLEANETVSLTLANGSNYIVGTPAAVTATIINDDAVTAFPRILPLASLDGSNGFALNGISAGDYSGWSVGSAGDVNGDGFDDLIIGARGADPNGNSSGQSYVVFGANSGLGARFQLADINGSNGFILSGVSAGDFSGGSVSSAGDINGDGFDDLIIGAVNAGNTGRSYVIFGRSGGFSRFLNLSDLNGANGFAINGISPGDNFSYSISRAGDINGDGINDLIIGARTADPNGLNSGRTYVVFGRGSGFGSNLNLASLDGKNGFALNGINAGDYSGISVSSAGDINGDSFDDLIIGARGADPNSKSSSGQSYLVFGRNQFENSLNLATLDGSNGLAINGINAGDYSGWSVNSAGDINGDGFDDVIIGSFAADKSYVVFGKSSGFTASLNLSELDGINGFTIDSVNFGDRSGRSVSSAGDINGDGFDDLIIGARNASPNGYSSGQSYLIFGRRNGFIPNLNLSLLNGINGFAINGINARDYSGGSVSGAGDVNGDGFDDLIIGARGADPNGLSSGQSYVVFGRAASPIPVITLSVAPTRVNEDNTANLVYTFTRSGSLTNPLTVNYTVGGNATNGTDYASIGNSVTFAANAATARVTVDPIADTAVESNENVSLTLTRDFNYIIGRTTAVTGTIVNDDVLPLITLAVSPASVNENGTRNLVYTFTRTKNLGQAINVNFTVAGTATVNTDYLALDASSFTATTGQVAFSAGQATKTLTIDPRPDTVVEANETVRLTLAANANYKVGTTGAITGTITNDDGGAANDTLTGGTGNDNLNGQAGNDVIVAGLGNDTLTGGLGNDTLTGNEGQDRFVFNSPGEKIDRITDFVVVDDTIAISSTGFAAGLTTTGTLAANRFIVGTASTTVNHRFIYNNSNGQLLFDVDGLGGTAAVLIGNLNTGLAMTNADFVVI